MLNCLTPLIEDFNLTQLLFCFLLFTTVDLKQIWVFNPTELLSLSVQALAATLSKPTLLASANPDERASITYTDITLTKLDSNF